MGFAFVGTGSVGRSHNKAHKRWLDNVGLRYSLEGRTVDNPVEPLTNFVFVKVDETPDETEGGIILTKKAKKKSTTGTVISVGPGKTHPDSGHLVKIGVKPGEKVVYGEFDGTEIDYEGSPHTLIRDDDILVKFDGDKLTRENVMMTSDKMLVRVETKEQETTGGLLIAPTAQKGTRPSVGEVVSVGPGRPAMNGEPIEMDVKVGDMVKFRDFAGNEVVIGEEDFSVIRMQECLAKY
eukprot:CAMPEP_0118646840 /NCGR_PEP_ID=MMETSP0785-20121206/8281_1 /TAXON_ID=91992 /ORGANISM="Bolidomonas pacifica, Strain CCMP 1866" /LENGTH=236 /DNA_ID=CAMNT_0006538881 /DNA_START=83 /DNA_END=793 /DNA_ORIENTATION=+